MLIIAGHVQVDPERRDDYVARFTDLVRRARATEGCLDLAITADALDAGRVNNYERWASQEALEAWREVCDPPETDIAIGQDEVSLFDVGAERSPF